jgi:hypothetical protein
LLFAIFFNYFVKIFKKKLNFLTLSVMRDCMGGDLGGYLGGDWGGFWGILGGGDICGQI